MPRKPKHISLERLEVAIEMASQPTYGDMTGRYLGMWDWGFEEGRKATIRHLCDMLEVEIPTPRNRILDA